MSTSSITWVKKVALARISTSRNRDLDWGMMAVRASRRCSRHGEKTSATGTANSHRQGKPATRCRARPRRLRGRRPTTWSRWSIASRSGSRWAAVQRAVAEVTRMIGWSPSASPCSRACAQPIPCAATTKASAGRRRWPSRSSNPWPTWSGVASGVARSPLSDGPGSITITRTPPPRIGGRRAAASRGWIQSSSGGGPSPAGSGLIGRGASEVRVRVAPGQR